MNICRTTVLVITTVTVFCGVVSSQTLPRQNVVVLGLYAEIPDDGRPITTRLDPMEVLYLTNLVRVAVGRSLPAEDFIVLPCETIDELLPPTVELKDCHRECVVDVARMLGVDYIFTGEILGVDGEHWLQLMVHECWNGGLLDGRTARSVSYAKASDVEEGIEYVVSSLCESVMSDYWSRQEALRQSLPPNRKRVEFSMLLGASWPPPQYLMSRGFSAKTGMNGNPYLSGNVFSENHPGLSYTLSVGIRLFSEPVYVIPGVEFNSVQFWPSKETRSALTSFDPTADLTVYFRTVGASIKLLATEAEIDPGGLYLELLCGRYELVTKAVSFSEELKIREHGLFFGAGLGARLPISKTLTTDLKVACHFARLDLVKFTLSLGFTVGVGG